MTYEAGQSISIPSSTISDAFETAPLDLRFNRISNSEISALLASTSSATVNEDGILSPTATEKAATTPCS